MLMQTDAGEASHPMEFLLEEELNLPTVGEIRKGWVVEHQNNLILIDIGAKSEGMIDNQELASFDKETRAMLAVGNEVAVYVTNIEDHDGNIIVSYSKALQEKDWQMASDLLESQDIYKSKVIGCNRGGLLLSVGLLRGFLPNSQIGSRRFANRRATNEQLQKLIGETMSVKVIEVDRERNRLILSERAATKELREERRARLLEEIQEGDEYDGRVINLTNYGAFVDIGGVEGLVHLSELSWKRISNPADVIAVGDEVQVSVLSVDQERQRIALSIKRLEPDPWTMIDELYEDGQLIEANITRLTKFGAFARLNDQYGLEGLIHISELSDGHVEHPREVVKSADHVTVRIIRIDPDQRQLGLSLKQVASAEYMEADFSLLAEE
jgi:small subunit ribosomal protein S1